MRKYRVVEDLYRKKFQIQRGIRFLPYFLTGDRYIVHNDYSVWWYAGGFGFEKPKDFDTFEEAKAVFDEIIKPRRQRFVTLLKHP